MLVLCIAACLLFSAGFLLRGNSELMERLGIVAAKDPSSVSQGASPEVSAVASRLDEVEKMLSSGSLDSYDADATTRAVLDSFLKNTDDAYARYFDDARYTSFVDVATDEYPGVGVFFSEQNGKAFALDVFENSSASDAGVRQGDVVVATTAIVRRIGRQRLPSTPFSARRARRSSSLGCDLRRPTVPRARNSPRR
ncbi:MAG: hypothetical protein ACLTQI_03820 [Slackia sp.]